MSARSSRRGDPRPSGDAGSPSLPAPTAAGRQLLKQRQRQSDIRNERDRTQLLLELGASDACCGLNFVSFQYSLKKLLVPYQMKNFQLRLCNLQVAIMQSIFALRQVASAVLAVLLPLLCHL